MKSARSLFERLERDKDGPQCLRDALVDDMPDANSRLYEFAARLQAIDRFVTQVLASGVDLRDSEYLSLEGGYGRAMSVRRDCIRASIRHAEMLGDSKVCLSSRGWTLLMATWVVIAKLTILVSLLDDDHDDDDHPILLDRERLFTTSGGLADVPHMSMSELRMALDLVRDRLVVSMRHTDASFARYIRALELRAAEFVCMRVEDDDEYDVALWVRGTRTPTSGAIATFAWTFTLVKRHVLTYQYMSLPAFYETRSAPGYVCSLVDRDVHERAAVAHFLGEYMRSLTGDDHAKEFASLAQPHFASVADAEIQSYIFGMFGSEDATIVDILNQRRTPEATAYASTKKFERPLVAWFESAEARHRVTGGRGDVGDEVHTEALAVLYALRTLTTLTQHVVWDAWFLVSISGLEHVSGATTETRVRRGIAAGMPFVVQRLGRYACIVPRLPPTIDRNAIESRAQVPLSPAGVGTVLYDTRTLVDALALWARFMLDGHRGRVHHSPGVRLAPLLRVMLGTTDARQ